MTEIKTIDVQMVIGQIALGYGLYGWIGVGALLITTSILLGLYNGHRDDQN